MMGRNSLGRRLLSGAVVTALLMLALPTASVAADGVPTGYLLIRTNSKPAGALVRFSTGNPGAANLGAAIAITGTGGKRILGIDIRPADGKLYGMSEESKLYRINPATGSATQIGLPGANLLDPFPGFFEGLGFDFNAVPDRIRLTEDDGAVNGEDDNFRANPNTGEIFIKDSDLGGPTDVDIPGVAHTNAYKGATTTTLYGIETFQLVAGNSRLVVIEPPNSGVLTTIDSNGNGLGFPPGDSGRQEIGFDMVSDRNLAFATLQRADGYYRLYRIDLAVAAGGTGTGDATLVGRLGSIAAQDAIAGFTVRGLALLPPTYVRTLSLSYSSGAFRGQMVSSLAECFQNKLVKVYRVRAGADLKIGSDLTNSLGRYAVPKARRPGKYYAVAPRVSGPFGTCLVKRSAIRTLS